MYGELSPASKRAITVNDFTTAYRDAEASVDAALAGTGFAPEPGLDGTARPWCR